MTDAPFRPTKILNPAERVLSITIFSSRWLQAPLYFGLIVAQGLYGYMFGKELWHLVGAIDTVTETELMLIVLGLIDVVMISNLLIMVIIGGYETFVSRLGMDDHPDRPEWLGHVNASTMKIKLSMALIGISSIHLLKSFINVEHMAWEHVGLQVLVHCVFLVSAVAMAWTARVTEQLADH